MEPMTLGSPVGSPAQAGAMSGNTSQYLPSFLMGEQQAPNTARSNTLSPNKAGRNVSFGYAASPGGVASPADYNRSQLGQKTLFGGFQESATPTTPQHGGGAGGRNYMGTPTSHTAGVSGPPTQGLFDALRNERNQVQTPTRSQPPLGQSPYLVGTPIQQTAPPMQAAPPPYYSMQQTYQHTPLQQQFNDSYFSNANNASFNTSTARGGGIVSPLASTTPQHLLNNSNVMYAQQQQQSSNYPEFWVTVFGFPPNATGTVLQHFAQCGTILDKVFPAQTGNWVHLKYASRMECDKALNYNEKILANNIMIGVTQCKDTDVVDKENIVLSNEQYNNSQSANTPVSTQAIKAKVRPLVQSAGNENSVVASPSAPQKVSGLVNKAMDLFFGW